MSEIVNQYSKPYGLISLNKLERYGILGEFAFKYSDADYYVGDIVKVKLNLFLYDGIIVKDEDGVFVMGFKLSSLNCNFSNMTISKKVRSYKDVRVEEIIDFSVLVCNIIDYRKVTI